MARNHGRCLFSDIACRECPIYRGRHQCITHREARGLDAVGTGNYGSDWRTAMNDFFGEPNDPFRKRVRSYGWEEPGGSER